MSKNMMNKVLMKRLLQAGRNIVLEAYVAGRNDVSRSLYNSLGGIPSDGIGVPESVLFESSERGIEVSTRKRRKPPTKQEAARRMKQGKYMGMMRRMPAKVRSHAKSLQKKFGLDRAIKFMSSQPVKNKKS